MTEYYYDPVLDRLEQLIIQNIPFPDPDPYGAAWQLYTAKVNSQYLFLIFGHQELFERKKLAYIVISPQIHCVDFFISKQASSSQINLLNDAMNEIYRRLPQIPFPQE